MKILLISFLLFPAKIFGDYIIHEKIHEAPHNLPCTIEAFVNILEEDIHNFSLLYRPMGNLEYLEAPMMIVGQLKYIAVIPGNFMVRDHSEYYLLLELSNGEKVTFPQKDAIHNPITIQIDLPTEKIIPITSSEINNFDIVGLSPDVMIISPQPGERVRIQDLFIALSYFKETNVDPTLDPLFARSSEPYVYCLTLLRKVWSYFYSSTFSKLRNLDTNSRNLDNGTLW